MNKIIKLTAITFFGASLIVGGLEAAAGNPLAAGDAAQQPVQAPQAPAPADAARVEAANPLAAGAVADQAALVRAITQVFNTNRAVILGVVTEAARAEVARARKALFCGCVRRVIPTYATVNKVAAVAAIGATYGVLKVVDACLKGADDIHSFSSCMESDRVFDTALIQADAGAKVGTAAGIALVGCQKVWALGCDIAVAIGSKIRGACGRRVRAEGNEAKEN